MELDKTINNKYKNISIQIVKDIFYVDGLSNRGRLTLIRQYTEILCRIILNKHDHFKLGRFERLFKEQNQKENPQNDLLIESVKSIRDLGNRATHVDEDDVSEKDCDIAKENINFIISYFFINYFTKYTFGKNEKILTIFSLLPPFIREMTLFHLYENNKKNIYIIDKLTLAILKSKGKCHALNWIEENKGDLNNIKTQENNMYVACKEKIIYLSDCIEKNLFSQYKTFEESLYKYNEEICNYNDSNKEVIELINLMDFVYTGRIPSEQL